MNALLLLWLFLAFMAPVFSAVDVVATYPIDSSFNTSAATPASFSSFNMSADTPELISSINTSAAASVPIVLFYIIRPTPTCLAVDTDFDPVSAAEICEAMANPPPMVKKGSSAQIGQTDTTVQLSLSLLCAVICITYIREFKYTWVLHKQIQDFFTPPFDAWDKKPAVEATGNAKQVEYATVTAYIATAAQIAEPAAANKDELLDSDMIRIAQSDAPVLTAKHKRMFRGKMRAKLRSVDKAIKLAIKLKRAYHAK